LSGTAPDLRKVSLTAIEEAGIQQRSRLYRTFAGTGKDIDCGQEKNAPDSTGLRGQEISSAFFRRG